MKAEATDDRSGERRFPEGGGGVTRRRSIPFSISLLVLMALIVVPLSSVLLWLGWRSVDALEERHVEQRMATLESAVSSFMASGLRIVVAAGQTLAETQVFASASGAAANDERLRQLLALLKRHPNVEAVFVGYEDGLFLYVGDLSDFSVQQREELDAPDDESRIMRVTAGEGGQRQETWRFVAPNGSIGAERTRPGTYDPRVRPWYVEALRQRAPVLTEPYRFAWSGEPGISAGVPMGQGGVIGFDFTLGTLARLLSDYKITPNTLVVLAMGRSDVLIETPLCQPGSDDCFAEGPVALAALRGIVREAVAANRVEERDIEAGGRTYKLLVHPMPALAGQPYAVGAAVPVEELRAESQALLRHSAIMAGGTVAAAVIAILLAALLLSRSMARLAVKTERIRNLDFSDTMPVRSHIAEVHRLSDAVERMREGLEVFGRYVSKGLVTQIMHSPQSAGVGGTRREMTVMFTDIEGFSRLSEGIEPELLTNRLSRYFEALGDAISANQGMIDKYIGDSIMAFWNAPEPDPDHVVHACRAALQAEAAGRRLAERWRARSRPVFRTRFGLHTGSAVVGNVGARERINYTLVGPVANQASRLEGLNKVYGTTIMASGEVVAAAAEQFVWRPLERIVTAGTTEVLEAYELLAEAVDAPQHAEFLEAWSSARAAYIEGRFNAAIVGFKAALALRPDDGPCRLFIARCEELLRSGRPADWDGAWRFDKK